MQTRRWVNVVVREGSSLMGAGEVLDCQREKEAMPAGMPSTT